MKHEQWSIFLRLSAALGGGLGGGAVVAQPVTSPAVSGPTVTSPAVASQSGVVTSIGARATQSDQIAAAVDYAVEALRVQVSQQRITADMTIQQYLDRTLAFPEMMATLRRAEQIGGPRWVDETTVQIKLELPARRVLDTLADIAREKGPGSPLSPDAISQKLSEWKDRTFSSTGSAIGADRLKFIRPTDATPAWANVADAGRIQTLDNARANAADRVAGGISAFVLPNKLTIDDVMKDDSARTEVFAWLGSRPVTGVQFHDDLTVQVTLAVQPDQFLDEIVRVMKQTPSLKNSAPGERDVVNLKREFALRMPSPIGSATAISTAGNGAPVKQVVIPRTPPDWVGGSLDAESTAEFVGTKLRTKASAEALATEALRARILGMNLSPGVTVGDAAKGRPEISDAVARALVRTRVFKVEYKADGSVMVRVAIDSRVVWGEIAGE